MKPSGTWRHNVNVLSSNKLPVPFSTTPVLGKLWGDTEHFLSSVQAGLNHDVTMVQGSIGDDCQLSAMAKH